MLLTLDRIKDVYISRNDDGNTFSIDIDDGLCEIRIHKAKMHVGNNNIVLDAYDENCSYRHTPFMIDNEMLK
ncbi:MAG: hypothetical protein IKZ85_08210 [Pseudobutyrivibrio sp.]|nr:hypothetical protein [Pseudobutyrivibrio sp.]